MGWLSTQFERSEVVAQAQGGVVVSVFPMVGLIRTGSHTRPIHLVFFFLVFRWVEELSQLLTGYGSWRRPEWLGVVRAGRTPSERWMTERVEAGFWRWGVREGGAERGKGGVLNGAASHHGERGEAQTLLYRWWWGSGRGRTQRRERGKGEPTPADLTTTTLPKV